MYYLWRRQKKAVSGEMKDRMLRCMVVKTRNRVVAFIYLVVIYFLESTSPDAGLHPVFLFYLKLGTIERNLQWDIYSPIYIALPSATLSPSWAWEPSHGRPAPLHCPSPPQPPGKLHPAGISKASPRRSHQRRPRPRRRSELTR